MRSYAALFLLPALMSLTAHADVTTTIEPQDQARIQAAIMNGFNAPRVIDIVNDANSEQKSVTVDLTAPGQSIQDNSFELTPEAAVEVEVAPAPASERTTAILEEQAKPTKPKSHITHFGMTIDAGVPDGAGASIVYRPWKWLRARIGGNYNGVSGGISGGVTLLPPVFFPILPTATIEAGHYFEGDANWIARLASGKQSTDIASLRRVSYDYVNGHLGLEFGSQNRFVFYVHGGFTYLHTTINDLQTTINQQNSGGGSSATTVTVKDPTVNLFVPSGKIGFLIYFM